MAKTREAKMNTGRKWCPICGTVFQTSKQYQRFCSRECYYAHLSGAQHKQICRWCGKAFISMDTIYCSPECRSAAIQADETEAKPLSTIDIILRKCQRMGISYADYQKMDTLYRMEDEEEE